MTEPASRLKTETAYFGVPWEDTYGYVQAVRAGNTIYISGQLSHDAEGAFIAPAQLDLSGRITEASCTEAQMRATYANAVRILAHFGATLDHVVEETIYAIDVDAAFAAAGAGPQGRLWGGPTQGRQHARWNNASRSAASAD
jgi:enamine deaminase RidA (YjgF/YER057c/UK114 family)